MLDHLIEIESKDHPPGEKIAESARIDAVRVDVVSGETKVHFWNCRPIFSNQESRQDETGELDNELVPLLSCSKCFYYLSYRIGSKYALFHRSVSLPTRALPFDEKSLSYKLCIASLES